MIGGYGCDILLSMFGEPCWVLSSIGVVPGNITYDDDTALAYYRESGGPDTDGLVTWSSRTMSTGRRLNNPPPRGLGLWTSDLGSKDGLVRLVRFSFVLGP